VEIGRKWNESRTGSAARGARGACLVNALTIRVNAAVAPRLRPKRLACAGGPELLKSFRREVFSRHVRLGLSLKDAITISAETGWCQISEAHAFVQIIFPFLDVRGGG
jgi:hypothetical protein